MSIPPISSAELKLRLIQLIGAQEDADILRRVQQLLEDEASRELAARVTEGERAIAEGRYHEPQDARSIVRERIARKYGK